MPRIPVADYALNAHTVDGYHASASPAADTLLALNADAVFPAGACASATDADTVDGIHASAIPAANCLLALDSAGKFPSSTVSGSEIYHTTRDWIFESPFVTTYGQLRIPWPCAVEWIHANTQAGSSVAFNIEERATLGVAGSNILSSDMVAGSAGESASAFSNTLLEEGNHLALAISAVSGSVDYLSVTLTLSMHPAAVAEPALPAAFSAWLEDASGPPASPATFSARLVDEAAPPAPTELYSGWYTDGVSPQARIDNLAVYAAQGGAQMLPYNCYTSGTTAVGAYLDEAASQGIKVWVSMRIAALGPPYPSEANWKAFINALKGYSAVKGWYISDEPEYAGPDRATIVQYYDWAKEADPDHPVSIAHAWIVRPEFAGPPACYDVVLLDVYPNYNSSMPTTCSGTTDEFNSGVRDSYRRWNDGKIAADSYGVPIEAVALGFGYHPDTGNCQYGVRDLTDAEHRWHTHVTTVLGYAGVLFWWDENNPVWVQTNPHTKALVANRFGEFSQFAAEMENGTTNDPQITASIGTTRLLYRYGVSGSRHVLLAANISRWDAVDNLGETLTDVQFTLPSGVEPSQVTVLDESRTITVTGGVFTDTFTRFQVHAYAFEV